MARGQTWREEGGFVVRVAVQVGGKDEKPRPGPSGVFTINPRRVTSALALVRFGQPTAEHPFFYANTEADRLTYSIRDDFTQTQKQILQRPKQLATTQQSQLRHTDSGLQYTR